MSIYKDIQINNTKILFLIPQGDATERSLTLPLHVITKDALCTLMERLTGRATRISDYLLNNSMQRIFFGLSVELYKQYNFDLLYYCCMKLEMLSGEKMLEKMLEWMFSFVGFLLHCIR